MNYEGLANFVTVFHATLIFCAFAGILISVRYKRFRPIESIIIIGAIVVWSLYGGCPLTSLENWLRMHAGNPLPIADIGFIPFYFHKWFGLSVTDHQFIMTTYILAAIFIVMSIEWLSPFVNPELVKIRKSLGVGK